MRNWKKFVANYSNKLGVTVVVKRKVQVWRQYAHNSIFTLSLSLWNRHFTWREPKCARTCCNSSKDTTKAFWLHISNQCSTIVFQKRCIIVRLCIY